MIPQLSIYDICTIFLYLICMVFMGIWFHLTNNKTANEFIGGDKSFSHLTLGISIFATWVSNLGLLSFPAIVYSKNWSDLIMFITLPIAGIFVIKFLIPIYRNQNNISAYSYIETRFGHWAALYCVICYAITNCFRLGIIIYLMAIALKFLTGYTEQSIILITCGIVILYTFLGGLKCVIWTDVFQAILFFSGTLLILTLIYNLLPCNFQEAIIYSNKHSKFSLGNSELSLLKPTIWVFIINGLLANLQGLGTEQGFVQRYMSAKNEISAKKSIIVATCLIFTFSIILFLIGTLLFVYYNQIGNDVFISNENILLEFISQKIPIGLKGIVIITIMAAAMSSISSEINAMTTLFYQHAYTKFNKKRTDEKDLKTLYGISIIIGIIPIVISFFIVQKSNFFETWDNFDSLITGGIIGLFLLAFFFKNAKANAAFFILISGFLIITWLTFSPSWQFPISRFLKNPLDANINVSFYLLVILSLIYATKRIFKKAR